jgi:hypothetical protein
MHFDQKAGWARGLAVMAAVVLLPLAGTASVTSSSAGGTGRPATSKDFNPRHFTHPLRIDNKWVPVAPGTQFVLEGNVDGVPHRIVTTVTDLTKVVDGVRTAVLWDVDYQAGQIAESELFFNAQDNDGNVWNLGEYPEEYEKGVFHGAPNTWIGGVDRAKPGILMREHPEVGTSSYSEGRAPNIGFWDEAKVLQTGAKTCIPLGCYKNVLIIDEWSPLAPKDGHQRKYYAAGVGNIRIVPAGGLQAETLKLVKLLHLSSHELSKVREEALKLEQRAYRVSTVYQQTPPATRRR